MARPEGLPVHHLAFRTRDVSRLVAFYVDVLGLPVLRETPGRSVWLRAGNTVVMIERSEPDEPAIPAGSRELIAFSVCEEERAFLRERFLTLGIALDGETAFTTYVRDPDGRRVGVSTYPFA